MAVAHGPGPQKQRLVTLTAEPARFLAGVQRPIVPLASDADAVTTAGATGACLAESVYWYATIAALIASEPDSGSVYRTKSLVAPLTVVDGLAAKATSSGLARLHPKHVSAT